MNYSRELINKALLKKHCLPEWYWESKSFQLIFEECDNLCAKATDDLYETILDHYILTLYYDVPKQLKMRDEVNVARCIKEFKRRGMSEESIEKLSIKVKMEKR